MTSQNSISQVLYAFHIVPHCWACSWPSTKTSSWVFHSKALTISLVKQQQMVKSIDWSHEKTGTIIKPIFYSNPHLLLFRMWLQIQTDCDKIKYLNANAQINDLCQLSISFYFCQEGHHFLCPTYFLKQLNIGQCKNASYSYRVMISVIICYSIMTLLFRHIGM